MRILSWNINGAHILGDSGVYDKENLNYIISKIHEAKPDIICLQETHRNQESSQVEEISQALGGFYFASGDVGDSHIKDSETLCLSLLSRYKILESDFIRLPHPDFDVEIQGENHRVHEKGFVVAEIEWEGQQIRVLSGHMVPFHRFGKNFMDYPEIRSAIEEIILSDDKPTLIGADMNYADDLQELIPKIFDHKYKNVLPDIPTTPKGTRSDKIIVSKHWTCLRSSVMEVDADHFVCQADLKLYCEALVY